MKTAAILVIVLVISTFVLMGCQSSEPKEVSQPEEINEDEALGGIQENMIPEEDQDIEIGEMI